MDSRRQRSQDGLSADEEDDENTDTEELGALKRIPARSKPSPASQSSTTDGVSERRPSRNIYNLKLAIPKPGFPSSLRANLPEAPGTSPPLQFSASPQMSGRSPQRTYERSQSSSAHTHKAMNTKQRRQNLQRQSSMLQRAAMLRSGSRRVMQATESFIGIGKNCNEDHEKWKMRHLKYCSIKYGKLKPEIQQKVDDHEQETLNSKPTSPTGYFPQRGLESHLWRSHRKPLVNISGKFGMPHSAVASSNLGTMYLFS